MEGIYIAYLTGKDGYSILMFVLRDGRITGADAGGVKYSGYYRPDANKMAGELYATFPAGAPSITGVTIGKDPFQMAMPFELSMLSLGSGSIEINSPLGKVSASIQKLQELP